MLPVEDESKLLPIEAETKFFVRFFVTFEQNIVQKFWFSPQQVR